MATFSLASLEFLAEAPLRDMAWLKANRPAYEEHLVQPLRALVATLTPAMTAVDPGLEGSISRIYRDMRFSRGQPPLRESVWLVFQDRRLDPMERPAFFFEVYADRYRYGMGFYGASTQAMGRIRQTIDADPDRFSSIVAGLPAAYSLMGESYRKTRAAHLPAPIQTWYDRKSFWIQVERAADPLLLSPGLGAFLSGELPQPAALYRFLIGALAQPD